MGDEGQGEVMVRARFRVEGAGLCPCTAVGTATGVPSGVEVVPEQAIRISGAVRTPGKVNFHMGGFPSSLVLTVGLARYPVLLGNGSLSPSLFASGACTSQFSVTRTLISRGLGVSRTTVRRYGYAISPPANRPPMNLMESGVQA